MRRFPLLFLLLFLPTTLSAATWMPLHDGASPAQPLSVTVTEAAADHTIVQVTVHGLYLDTVTLEGREYTGFDLHEGRISALGEPEVPLVGRLLAIPTAHAPRITVLGEESITLERVTPVPVQPRPNRCATDWRPRFACDQAIYEGAATYPGPLARIGEVGSFRDVDFAQLQVFPVQFDPLADEVVVTTSLALRIDHPGINLVSSKAVAPAFKRLYLQTFLNQQALLFDEQSHAVERMVIISADKFAEGMAPFVAWKRQMGFPVTLYTLGEIGATANAIKSHLQTLYDDPTTRPSYVILVGDIGDMPTLYGIGNCASDFMFTQLDGSDLVSDVLVSRISVSNANQLALQVEKFLSYEQGIPAGSASNWLSRAVGISSSEGSGASNDDVRMDELTGLQTAYGYDPVDQFYHSQGNDTAGNISAAINEGRGWVSYMGHGSGTAWATTSPDYSTSHINALTNVGMLPAVMDVSCSNGGFDDHAACFAEAWLRANHNGDPAGAVAIYSASTPAAWDEPAEMAIGVVNAFVNEVPFRWGELCFAGRTYAYNEFGNTNTIKETFQQYVVFGDVSVAIRSKSPTDLEVAGPEVLPVGELEETFTVTDSNGQPVADALVHLHKEDEVDLAGYTDSNGQVDFTIETAGPGVVSVTVTAFDAVPYQAELDVTVTGCGVLKVSPDPVACDGEVTITLWDQDLNQDAGVAETVQVVCSAPGTQDALLLTETGPDTNQFQAVLPLAPLGLTHGATVTVSYDDAGCDGGAEQITTSAVADCVAPVISAVTVAEVTVTSAVITFVTDESATAHLLLGAGTLDMDVPGGFGTEHQAVAEGLQPGTQYLFKVLAVDSSGNEAEDDNNGALYGFVTPSCQPDCGGKQCGDDGCGGTCGACGPDQECTPQGVCFGGAGCEEKNDPGCGGCLCEECVCAMDSYCCQWSWDSICVDECLNDCGGCGMGGCEPDCAGKECGADGCGGTCGECADGESCTAGQCVAGCVPDCMGKVCGWDGCGGLCGECPDGQECTPAGQCKAVVLPCDGLAYEGCCDLTVLTWCEDGILQTLECGGSGCGWNGANGYYDCNQQGGDPSGTFPLDCPWTCHPDCEGKSCGNDGCGGSCGACGAGLVCENGLCLCVPDCAGKECGADGCGGFCGACEAGFKCNDYGMCECVPNCSDEAGEPLECGDDGCDGSCGVCADGSVCENGLCVCAPDCEGKECGDDGCGGSCGECAEDELCDLDECVPKCVPDCMGKECGDDGCDGSCGECDEGSNCEEGLCVPDSVTPDVVAEEVTAEPDVVTPAPEVVPSVDTSTPEDDASGGVVTGEIKLGGKSSGCTASGNGSTGSLLLLVLALLALVGLSISRRPGACR